MLNITNDVEDFFLKKQFDSIAIYGAGELGYRLGEYMNKTHYTFELYIDKKAAVYGQYECQNHMVCCLENVYRNMEEKDVGVVISSMRYEEILDELKLKSKVNWTCLLPVWHNSTTEFFSTNRLLGFFRRRALEQKGKCLPTLISNDCIAGRLYEAFGVYGGVDDSPTINVWISYDDFLKICLNPEIYLQTEIKAAGLTSTLIDNSCPYPTGAIRDVKVQFVHTAKEISSLIEKWNRSLKKINWDNMLFLIREGDTIPKTFLKGIKECTFPYVVLKHTDIEQRRPSQENKSLGPLGYECHLHYIPDIIDVFSTGKAIETAFDIVGWAESIF